MQFLKVKLTYIIARTKGSCIYFVRKKFIVISWNENEIIGKIVALHKFEEKKMRTLPFTTLRNVITRNNSFLIFYGEKFKR